jgi:hypothetical protein
MVHCNSPTERRIVLYPHVSTQHHIVGSDDPVFNHAIMRDVTRSHEIAVATDRGNTQVLFGSAIDRHALAKNIAVTDDHLCRRSLIRKILWLSADHTSWEELVVPANGGMARERNAILKPCPTTNANMRSDHAVMSDPNILVEFGSWVDYRSVCYDR